MRSFFSSIYLINNVLRAARLFLGRSKAKESPSSTERLLACIGNVQEAAKLRILHMYGPNLTSPNLIFAYRVFDRPKSQ